MGSSVPPDGTRPEELLHTFDGDLVRGATEHRADCYACRILRAEERVNQLEQAARECGHFVRGPHWFDPLSVPMPGCALCEALSAAGEDAK